jgi:hypothetical protein
MRLFCRAVLASSLLSLLLVSASFAKSPAKSKHKRLRKKSQMSVASSTNSTLEDSAEPAPAPRATSKAAMLAGQRANQKTSNGGDASSLRPAPKYPLLQATTGTLGLFTVETADTLPKKGVAFSVDGDKFTRQPGSVSVLNMGANISVGVTNWLNIYANVLPYSYTHIGNPNELSLAPPSQGGPPFAGSIYPTLFATGRAGYVEDYPFAANNHGAVGAVTLGIKFGLESERRGAPFSFSVRNDFFIPTRTSLADLLANGTQMGRFNDQLSATLSKKWGNVVTATFDVGYRFTGVGGQQNGVYPLTSANQIRAGAGWIFFPERRFQPMTEYTAVVFDRIATRNSTFGPRDPVDTISGFRVYLWKNFGIDIGYRYMLNLPDSFDRHGFVIKMGATYAPAQPAPFNHAPSTSCAVDKSMVYVGSGDTVTVSALASDPDNDPLTYTWSSSGGRIDGNGPQVRWLSTGVSAGTYTVTLHVDDGRGGAASCSSEIRVEQQPNRP